jgi:adenylate cyclase
MTKTRMKKHALRKNAAYALPLALLVGAIIAFSFSTRGETATDQIYDSIRTTQPRNDVAIIGIDDKSLHELGAWPWDRTVFAELTEALGKASVKLAAFDVLFLEPRSGDEAFVKALKEARFPIILASKTEGGTTAPSFLAGKAPNVLSGVANVHPDADGKVRSYPSCTGFLAYEAYQVLNAVDATACAGRGFFRYPDHVATYSLVDVLRRDIPAAALAGKTVFIGSVSLGLEDHFVGRTGSKVPGVFIHSSLLISLLNGASDNDLSPWAAILLFLAYTGLALASLLILRSLWAQFSATLLLLLTLPVLALLLFDRGYVIPLPWLALSLVVTSGYVSLVRFIFERRQNEEIRSMFSKYVHKDVLEELMERGGVKLGGEKKELTVLFSDIRGFTTLSESLSPEELTSVLNDYLSAMTPHILEERGTIDKFIGDAIMAFWNAPLSVRNHEHHAVVSALRMHDALARFNEEHGTTLAAGVGLHAGPAVVGNVGGQDRVNYTILGDTVNLASRLEGLTKKYGVTTLVTEAVRDKVHDEAVEFRLLDTITVVGKSLPTRIYEVRRKGDFGAGILDTYEKAYASYVAGKWDEAEERFGNLVKLGDHPGEKMLARIPELRKKTDWDGVWRFDEK